MLHVAGTWAPDPTGGAERYVGELAAGLAEEGVASIIAAPGMEAVTPGDGGGAFRYVMPAVSGRQLLGEANGEGSVDAARALSEIARRSGVGLVNIHSNLRASGLAAVKLLKLMQLPVVFTYHDTGYSCPRGDLSLMGRKVCDGNLEPHRCLACCHQAQGVPCALAGLSARAFRTTEGGPALAAHLGPSVARLARWRHLASRIQATREFLHLIDGIVAPSKWVEELLARNGVDRVRISHVPQPVPADAVRVERRERRVGSRPVVLFIGHLGRGKGLGVLIQEVRKDPSLDIDVKVFVSTPNHRAVLEFHRIARETKTDGRFGFARNRPRAEVLRALAGADVLVVPSVQPETGPLVVLEGRAAGIPVVGPRMGGIEERVEDGVDGVLYEPGKPGALRAALRTALSMPRPPEARREELPDRRKVAREILRRAYLPAIERAGGRKV